MHIYHIIASLLVDNSCTSHTIYNYTASKNYIVCYLVLLCNQGVQKIQASVCVCLCKILSRRQNCQSEPASLVILCHSLPTCDEPHPISLLTFSFDTLHLSLHAQCVPCSRSLILALLSPESL